MLDEVKNELRAKQIAFDNEVEIGAMVEVPSAATIIDLIAAEVDFVSIGTNDLIQYLMAVDRLNDRVAHCMSRRITVLRTLKAIIDGAREAKIPVSVCGEIAGDPAFAVLLMGMGASALSMTSSILPEVKYLIRQVSIEEARDLLRDVLKFAEARPAMEALEAFRRAKMGELAN